MKKLSLLILLLAPAFMAISQQKDTADYPYWIEMMQDPNANFFETQKAFEMYWDGRERDKGDGWKIFKRWEWFMEQRVDESGKKPAPDHVLKEYQKYLVGHQKAGISSEDHWNEIGPVNLPINGTSQPNGLGRINAIAFHPTNQNIFYAGAPSGGLWKTINGGSTWEPITDTLPTLGISSIVVDYSDPDILYIGTGDRDGGDAPGLGVWKSTNGGDTWVASNSGMGNRTVGKLLMNPLDSMTLLAAANGGIYRSVNGGQSWSRTSSNTSNYKDLVYKPGDTATVYASASGDFYRSTDGGRSWTMITSGLPGSNRAVIGVSADDPNYVYVVQTNQRTFKGLYRSTNSGASFSVRSTSPNIMDYSSTGSGSSGQAWYNLCVSVDPNDVDVIYVGGINIFKSTNGGVNWSINAHWVGSGGAPDIHADQHVMEVSPINDRLYVGNDGGVYYTANGGNTWPDISSGLAIAQIYKIGQSAQSRNLVINGYQDNGTAIYDGSWRTEIGGDGMECIVDPSDSMYMYGALYYGAIRRSTNYGIWFSNIASSISETGEWITPYILQEGNSGTMFAGFKNVWKSTNVKSGTPTWTRISNALGGTNTPGMRVLENSPADNAILYVAREDRTMWRSENITAGSPTFTSISLPVSTNFPSDIEAHPTNSNMVYITIRNDVYQSANKGGSWTNISGTLPNVSMNCIVYDTSSSGDLYVGTDMGVYFKGSWMTDWMPFNGGMPAAPEVTELEIYYDADSDESRIKAATYGRGLWSSPLYKRPVADFDAQVREICAGDSITFTDESTGFYTDVLWTFVGGTPSTSTDPNPTITYTNPGLYNVRLRVSNSIESKQKLITGFIRVDSLPVVMVNPDSASIILGDSVTLSANGSVYLDWSPSLGLNMVSGSPVVATPSSSITYTVTGTNEYCKPNNSYAQVYVEVTDPSTSGVGEIAFANSYLRIYPNPVNDFLVLDFKSTVDEDFTADLFDLTGKLIKRRPYESLNGVQRFEFDVRSVESGMYVLRLYSDNEQVSFRIMIDHSF